LLGSYQSKNISTVLATVEQLREKGWNIPETAIRNGMENITKNTGLQGR